MDYLFSSTIDGAVNCLEQAQGKARIISGGTDLFIDLESKKYHADVLIDISKIDGLNTIKHVGEELVIGAAVTHGMLAASPLVKKFATALAQGCASVGSKQIQNVATLAGNIINAQPAADGAVSLSVFEPAFTIVSPEGCRILTMKEMYHGFGKSTVDSTKEFLTEIRITCQKENQASAFTRLELRKALALPMLNTAVCLQVENNIIDWIRISMAPVGIGPVRAIAAEKWLAGKKPTVDNIREAANMTLIDAKPRSSALRGSEEYRKQSLPVIVSDCIHKALASLEVKK